MSVYEPEVQKSPDVQIRNYNPEADFRGLIPQRHLLGSFLCSGQLFNLRVLGSRVFGAKMSCKIFIALLLVVPLHFIERITGRCSRRIEHPCTFGATPAQKSLLFDPYQFAAHGLPSTPHDPLRFCFFETRFGIGPRRHCDEKDPLFIALCELPPKSPLFEHTSEPK